MNTVTDSLAPTTLALLDIAEAIITRGAREVIGENPLNCSRRWRTLNRRLRWARRSIRAYRNAGCTADDMVCAINAAMVQPHDGMSDDERHNGWVACRAAIAAYEVVKLDQGIRDQSWH